MSLKSATKTSSVLRLTIDPPPFRIEDIFLPMISNPQTLGVSGQVRAKNEQRVVWERRSTVKTVDVSTLSETGLNLAAVCSSRGA